MREGRFGESFSVKVGLGLLAIVAAIAVAATVFAGGDSSDPEQGTAEASAETSAECREAATEVAFEHAREVGAAAEGDAGEPAVEEQDAEEADAGEADGAEAEGESGESEAQAERAKLELARDCDIHVPEGFEELAAANQALSPRIGIDSPADAAYTAAQRAEALRKHKVIRGSWTPVGSGPLHSDDPDYPETYGNGFGQLAGRISDYAKGPGNTVYASVASGGVWKTTDKGKHWASIGDSLPTQTVGSVAYTTAHGGTLIAVTGDNAFGGATFGGLGVYRSTNEGASWKRSKGVPNGAQGFKAAVDPTNPKVIYAATGAGLYRSADGGRRFANVKLPTGDCAGKSLKAPDCFFANIVTDVVVQAPDKFGNKGGAVLAAVGWRDGTRKNFNGVPESPSNGLYSSASGAAGSFKRLDASTNGFTPQARIGRVEMGVATGPKQNHDYVYAVVQDAELFNSGTLTGVDVPDPLGLGLTATPTVLNGIYVSPDFGQTWKRMASAEQLLLPTSGSTLAQLSALGFGPGIQSWYDQWIGPDPTRQNADGIPTRLVFGLEEVYKNRLPQPLDGPTDFEVIGPYNATGGPCLLVLATPACSAAADVNPNQFTTHPDQHGGEFVPDSGGGVTLYAGNDGGNYTQTIGASGELTRQGFGKGANDGFHTLLPYGVAGAADGVVYAGLQDNGEMRIAADGTQNAVYGGDGIFTLVDPAHSDTAYEELPEAGINVTTDGGVSWTAMDPLLDNASFYAPLVMDPADSNHIVVGGREIAETLSGPATTTPGDNPTDASKDWQYVYDLGTKERTGADNQVSALAVRGDAVYAGFCGGCDVVRDKVKFSRGLATNVGGDEPPKAGTPAGWHKVAAKGLPKRFITGVAIDPHDTETVYVTLGASDIRPYAPPKALGQSGIGSRGGHVYVSTDGGEHFHNISANLKRTPALWPMIFRGRLLVATTVGVYGKRKNAKGDFRLLGKTLPAAPVFSLGRWPGHKKQILAASLGRGVYTFKFKR